MCLYSWDYTINHNENEDENAKKRSHKYDTSRPRSRHGHNIVNIKTVLVWWALYLSNTWSSIHEKVKQHWGWVEKMRCLLKKRGIDVKTAIFKLENMYKFVLAFFFFIVLLSWQRYTYLLTYAGMF